MTAFVLQTRATRTAIVPADLGNISGYEPGFRCSPDRTLTLSEPSFPLLQNALSPTESGLPLTQTILDVGQEYGLLSFLIKDRSKLLLDKSADRASHRDTDRTAVPPPR